MSERAQFRNGREIAYHALLRHGKGVYVDALLNEAFRTSLLDQRERSLAVELAYGVMRWQGRLDHIAKGFLDNPEKKIGNRLLPLLRMGLYQLFFTDRIPEHAAVDTAVEMAKEFADINGSKFINAVLRRAIREKGNISFPSMQRRPVDYLAAFYSHPAWLVKRWIGRYGFDDTMQLCKWDNETPAIFLRPNIRKLDTAVLLAQLKAEGFDAEDSGSGYVRLQLPGSIGELSCIKNGSAYVQDPSAGLVMKLLEIKGTETVLDLCAAPGGKATFIAERLNSGSLFASDGNYERLTVLKENFARMGLACTLAVMDGTRPSLKKGLFDTVLLDAPCSNTGVLGRRVESRWDRSLSDIKRYTGLQWRLLEGGASMVKPGGMLVYSTCSLEPEENHELIKDFLAKRPAFSVEPASVYVPSEYVDKRGFLRILPFKHRMDGMFGARLRKAG